VDKHPLIKKVPGGTPSGIAFVSFNNETFVSYGLEGSENAPVSRQAAEAYTTALTRLLDDNYPDPKHRTPMARRNFRISHDTAVVFWSRNGSAALDLFAESLQHADPEAVAALYGAPWKGQRVSLDDPSAFYALTLSGGQGRGTIRGWFESTVREVLHNVKRHFDDLNIVRPAAEADRPFPLWQLLRRTAVQGKNENIHPNLAAAVFGAVLKGLAYPRMLLDATVRRARAERTVFSDRAALLKAYLVRAKRLGVLIDPNFPEVKPMLDKDCPTPAYRLGRLFAVLEKVQADATNASTTIRDRFYGAASATPVVVFGQLLRKAPHHLAKLNHAPFYEKLIQEIMCALQPPSPFPTTLTLEEQGLFAVGYYHQRQDLFTKRPAEDQARVETTPSEGE
jgi:CRISPR-associated protein Csd1